MPRYKQTSVTAKVGLNFVRSIVERAGSLFHKIEQDSDLGIDALIEFVRNERPVNKIIALQVKSGRSYHDRKHNECQLPVNDHRDYWINYPVPVVGIVYVPSIQEAHWVDIKHRLKESPGTNSIRFARTEANRFDANQFSTVFMPLALRETPVLPLNRALTLFRSQNPDERQLGLTVLFRNYPNKTAAWDAFADLLVTAPTEDIPRALIYYLAHIPWHGDILYSGELITDATKDHVRKLLGSFGRPEVLKLLEFIDRENMICRGSLGQSVEAIVSSLPSVIPVLQSIAEDGSVPLFRRECAALISAMHEGRRSLPLLAILVESGSPYAQELLEYVGQYGEVNPYL